MKLNAYVNYAGKCKQACHFYEQNLGAKILMMMTFDEMPEANMAPPGMEKNVLHARLRIGDTDLLMSDGPHVEPMRSAYLTLSVDSNEEAERIHGLLAEGGEIFMDMGETFFAHRFSMLRDQFGANWMIIHNRPMGA